MPQNKKLDFTQYLAGIKKLGFQILGSRKQQMEQTKEKPDNKKSISFLDAIAYITANDTNPDEVLQHLVDTNDLTQEEQMKVFVEKYSEYIVLRDGHLYIVNEKVKPQQNQFSKFCYVLPSSEVFCFDYLTKDSSTGQMQIKRYGGDTTVTENVDNLPIGNVLILPLRFNKDSKFVQSCLPMLKYFGPNGSFCYCRSENFSLKSDCVCQVSKPVETTIETGTGRKKTIEKIVGNKKSECYEDCQIFQAGKCSKVFVCAFMLFCVINGKEQCILVLYDAKGSQGYAFYAGEFKDRDGTVYVVSNKFEKTELPGGKHTYTLPHDEKNDIQIDSVLQDFLCTTGEKIKEIFSTMYPFSAAPKEKEADVENKFSDE